MGNNFWSVVEGQGISGCSRNQGKAAPCWWGRGLPSGAVQGGWGYPAQDQSGGEEVQSGRGPSTVTPPIP